VYDLLPRFRQKTKTMIGDGRTGTRLSLAASSRLVKYGRTVEASGSLVDESGQGLVDRPVTIYRKYRGGQWKVDSSVTTRAGGSFSTSLSPHKKVALSASFSTGPGYWGSDSRVAKVLVRHAVTMAPSDRGSDSKGLYHYGVNEKRVAVEGRVRPAHSGRTVRVRLLKRSAKGTYHRVAERWPTLDESGSFSQSLLFTSRKSGTHYRVSAKMPGDGAHERGYSGSKYLVID
jgi:hypothetical protein